MAVRSIEGIQALQAYNLRLIVGLRGPYLDDAVRTTTASAHHYATAITHVDTGSLRGSHRITIVSARHEGFVSLDTSARNPRRGALTSEYGVYEHDRGGSHAFYKRTADEHGDRAGGEGIEVLMRSVRNGR